jgi:hypothetical protein
MFRGYKPMTEDKDNVFQLPDPKLYQELKYGKEYGYSDNIIAAAILANEIRKIRKLLEIIIGVKFR